MSPRPDVSEERKEQIIDAATHVFARSGYAKARMDDIAKETGVSKGTLYWYFKNKDAILLAILDNLLDRELAAIRKLEQQPGSAREQLLATIDITITDLKKMEPLTPLMFEFFSLAKRHKLIQKAIKEYFRKYMEVLNSIIQRGMDQGEFKPGNPQDVSIAIGAILEGTFLLRVYDSKIVKLEEHIRSSVDLLLDGLLV
ncbi:MAG: TetR/AcrR family transcriptional regulator [Chloroflexi bacterium]|nr:MAG: TetR/AcrR family transcriptional regulator [Chloroflexota bacterium]MBL1195510.1 TetR/AcrR family transcriptional regulator [Chloroflexota bacterium]NOH12792.1 TetR/AcrR family transcriptional regulator [Chloroflexota bacterium]